ncbi:SPRY domain-containing protein [Ditylenchus destructor]|uniref:SPRY domain-containing protein 7 n=1 Tax=Ditylenchus destructor TaxID=166010 RepID=A0AAD4QUQ3_9BILA|nr:SPRY domain-containing protein [Ditylenchus destructor]
MQGCFPFRMCLECLQGPSFTATQSYAHLRDEVHNVKLDHQQAGPDVVLLKAGLRICGSGGVLATAPIVQNKAYFQVHIQQSGTWGIGLATRAADLTKAPVTKNAWILNNEGSLMAENELVSKMDAPFQEGDTIGVAFDHVELKFFKEDQPIPLSISNVKGQVYPVVYVDDNAILDVKFNSFLTKTPAGYEEIMIEQTLL